MLSESIKSLDKWLAEGYCLIDWDRQTTRPIIDRDGRIIALLSGRPNDDSYTVACKEAYKLLEEIGKDMEFPDSCMEHMRGKFPAVNIGITHGKGTEKPHIRGKNAMNMRLKRIIEHSGFARIAQYQNGKLLP